MRSVDWLGTVGLGALTGVMLANPGIAAATGAELGAYSAPQARDGSARSAAAAGATQSELPRATNQLPAELPFFIAVRDGEKLVQQVGEWLQGLDPSNPIAEALDQHAGLNQARIGLIGIAAASGLSLEEALATLVGNELALTFEPESDTGAARFMLALAPSDPGPLDRMLHQVYRSMGLMQRGQIAADHLREMDQQEVVVLSEELLACRTENALLLTNDESLLKSSLQIGSDFSRSLESYTCFPEVAQGDIVFGAKLGSYRSLLLSGLPEALDNSLASILFGSELSALRAAEHISLRVDVSADSLQASMDVAGEQGLPSELQALLPVRGRESTWQAEKLAGYLGTIAVRRNWADVFAEREAIMPLAQAGELVNFAGTMSALLGAVDFIEDVLARIDGPIRFLAARRLDVAAPPSPLLPAMALIAPLGAELPAGLEQRIRAGATSALSLIGLEDAQQGRASILMDIDRYRGHRLVFGAYPSDDPGPKTGIRYNFSPAIAVVRGELIVASTVDFLKQIIDQVEDAQAYAEESFAADTLNLQLPRLAAVLQDNFEPLRVSRMLDEDESRAQAGAFVDNVLGLLRLGGDLNFHSRPTERGFEWKARLGLTVGE